MNLSHDLFLLMFNLSQLREKKIITQLFCDGLSKLFTPVIFCYSEQKKDNVIYSEQAITRNSSYGFIYSENLPDEGILPLLQNAIQMFAVILERLIYEQKLHKEKQSFEKIANERLEKINNYVKDLENAKLASLNLVDDLYSEIKSKEIVQKTLKANEEKFRSYVESAPNGIFVADKQGQYIDVNKTAEQITGYSREKLLNMSLLELCPNDEQIKYAEHFQKVVTFGKNSGDLPFIRKDGSYRYWTVDAVKLTEERFLGFVTDITERKETEKALIKSEERYRTIITSMSDIIFLLDKNDRFVDVHCKEKSEGLYIDRDVFLGKKLKKLLPPHVSSLHEKIAEQVRVTGKTQRYEYPLQIHNKEMWFVAILDLHKDGESIIATIRDITERKKREEQIKSSLREKEVLIQEVHHRVKNNLQLIISLLNLEMDHHGETTEAYKDTISRIRKFSNIHNRLYSQEDIANIDFATTIKESADELISVYSKNNKNVSLSIDIPNPIISLDKAIPLALIINELITNSLKYAFVTDGKINISIHINKHNQLTKFVYKDNGKGTADFQPGFGTKLVNMLAKQLGFKINIIIDNGICYTFIQKESETNSFYLDASILLVEDEFIIALDRANSLKNNGFNINKEVIDSGEKVVRFVQNAKIKPSLILMDIGLAEKMNGIEAAKEIRKDSDIPIIFMTGYEDALKKAEMSSIPNTDFLQKTCSEDELISTINKWLNKEN